MNPTTWPPATDPKRAGDAVVQIERLSIQYDSQCVLSDVDLSADAGRIMAVIGPSGCGKTSLLSTLNRLCDLVPGCHVSGTVRIGGIDVRDTDVDVLQLRRRVGMIFQKPNPFPLSIRRNLELPLREHGVIDRAVLAERIESTLKSVGLWDEVKDRLDRPALSLSGGQQQRLCIARALALQPHVLLLDEPCSALDPISTGVIEELLLGLRERLTQIVVTHNLAQARRIADDVAFFWMKNGTGRLIERGPAEQIFEKPRDPLTQAYVAGRSG
ncbi:phosphate ABC transporter ATP-binding protein [Maioricimonas rarisocia]|nr:phosphate ABC transporter ATP-binding protein [Maioricimonas rarisocia]